MLETLVALSVLTVAIAGAFTAAQTGISSSTFSKNQVTAFYLGAEGVEQIRNIRDNNALQGQHWLTGIALQASDPCYFGKVCTVDTLNNTISTCSGGVCPSIRHDSQNGFYGYEPSWDETSFVREVRLTQINSQEVSIVVTVKWSKGVLNRQFNIRENILNWQ